MCRHDDDRDGREPHFPYGDGADDALLAILSTAVPEDRRARDRAARGVPPPVVLLAPGEDGQARARQVARWLHACLHNRSEPGQPSPALLPHALITAQAAGDGTAQAGRPLTPSAVADWEAGTDRGTVGPLPLPDYRLLSDVADWVRTNSAARPSLREHCYAQLCKRSPVHRALEWLGGAGGGDGLPAVWHVIVRPFLVFLPRWWWSLRRTHRLVRRRRRGWYAAVRALPRSADFFADAANIGPDELDGLLLRALFADLNRATRPSRVSPWRRRRATRYVVLLELPPGPPGQRPAAPAARFLADWTAALKAVPCTAVTLVAVAGPGSAPPGAYRPLADAAPDIGAVDFRDTLQPVLARLPEEAGAWSPPRPPRRVQPGTWRIPVRWVAAFESVALIAALTVGGWLAAGVFPDPEPDDCLGGLAAAPSGTQGPSDTRPGTASPAPGTVRARYTEAEDRIERQNARAEAARRAGATVRTLAYLGTSVGGDGDEPWSDGALPELRGVALAQDELNDEANSDERKIWWRVERFDTGERFGHAVEAARSLAARAGRSSDDVVGAVGIAQSRDTTRAAVRVLDTAQVPTILTNATADAMQVGEHVHQIAPPSSREAEIAGQFMRHARIVQGTAGGCAPAQDVTIVQDPTDLYSRTLGGGFADAFRRAGGTRHTLWYTPSDGDAAPPPSPTGPDVAQERSIHGVSEAVCRRLQEASGRKAAVYWAARSRELLAFLNDFEDSTPCSGNALTVVGGNGLTNATLSGTYEVPAWLRLYHAAHVRPAGQSLSHIAEEFNARYAREFGADDPWRDDGHAALGYDAVQVMAEAANEAYRSSGGRSVNRESVQASLYQGVSKAGASGAIAFPTGEPVSRDKPVIMLYHTDGHSVPVLSCGTFAPNSGRREHWGPGDGFDCPTGP
ncbi:hypothetical protein RKE29_04480 [Streptomyces sp. B1866]|uniref:hypothetical protein n=1 Tax=Streptomyces sp. B1866 TaxID=3075431 RepID=UPI00288F9846|nr:hypothetical protein [Streptomyces sp. B1866]MDT3395906.1 hypothetical protein [Streptomyces sp. B1866]